MNQNNQIINFEFTGRAVRVVDRDGEPWFIAADVCAVLDISNSRDAVSRLDEDDKGVATTDTPGGAQSVGVVSESGVYSLVFTSRKPEARAFKKWVTSEVLPAIRNTGMYAVPKTLSGALRLAADQAEIIERQNLELANARPAVQFLEQYVETRSTKSLREVAKVLGQREREFITKLHADGIIFKQAGSWYPYADYHHRGYFDVKTGEANGHAFNQTRFTPSGIAWIAKRFGLMGAA